MFETEIDTTAVRMHTVSREPRPGKKQQRKKQKAKMQTQRDGVFGSDCLVVREEDNLSAGMGNGAGTGSGVKSWSGLNPAISRFTDSEVIIHEFEEELVQVRGLGASGDSIDSAGVTGISPPLSDDQVLKVLQNTVDELYGELTFAFFIKGIDNIFIYRGVPPCNVYQDMRGNTWFSSEYPRIRVCGAGESGRFKLLQKMQYVEAAAISLNTGYQRHGIISRPPISSYGSYGYSSWGSYYNRQETLSTWTRSTYMRGFRDAYDEDTEIGSIAPGPGVTGKDRPDTLTGLQQECLPTSLPG